MSASSLAISAAIRGDHLVLNLPDAVNPVVWQFDLSRARSSSIEAVPDAKGYAIRLKTAEGQVHDIAIYGSRDRAVLVLATVHETLAGDRGGRYVAAESDSKTGNWRLAVAAFLVLVILMALLFWVFAGAGTHGRGSVANDAPIPSGVPMSAEDVLKGRAP